MIYALRESLQLISEEELENCWERHKNNAILLYEELEKLGLELLINKKDRLYPLTAVKIP